MCKQNTNLSYSVSPSHFNVVPIASRLYAPVRSPSLQEKSPGADSRRRRCVQARCISMAMLAHVTWAGRAFRLFPSTLLRTRHVAHTLPWERSNFAETLRNFIPDSRGHGKRNRYSYQGCQDCTRACVHFFFAKNSSFFKLFCISLTLEMNNWIGDEENTTTLTSSDVSPSRINKKQRSH